MSSLSISRPIASSPLPAFIFEKNLKFFEVVDICRAARVCRLWNLLMQSQSIWEDLFEREGIPVVQGTGRDYQQDFKTLYPITISGRESSGVFGKVIGEIPLISQKTFDKLEEKDPFEPEKLIGENYVFVVLPALIKRTVDEETPLTLDKSGNLMKLSQQEDGERDLTGSSMIEKQNLMIPFSTQNFMTLCSYPLSRKENTPVFSGYSQAVIEALDGVNLCPDKIEIHLLKKSIVEASKFKTYLTQEELVRDQGFEVTSFRVRAFFNAMMILKFGTCPDSGINITRNREALHISGPVDYYPTLGKFVRGSGLEINYRTGFAKDVYMGIAPSVTGSI